MIGCASGISRLMPDLTPAVKVFDLVEATALISAQMRRMNIEDVPGAVEWCVERDSARWAEIRRQFWRADEYCIAGDMVGLRASVEIFWDSWRSLLDDYIAFRDGISQRDLF